MKRSPLIFLVGLLGMLASSNANALWPLNGGAPCPVAADQQFPVMCSDGAGGAILAWQDARDGTFNVYAARVTPAGATLWCGAVSAAVSNQQHPVIVADGAGGAVIAWEDERNGNEDIYTQRIGALGQTAWTNNGVAVCTGTGLHLHPKIVSDGAFGAIITWDDTRASSAPDIYCARFDDQGKRAWITNGVALCTATNIQSYPSIASDGAGGAIVTWSDNRLGTLQTDIYARRITAAGTALWTADGVGVCTAGSSQASPVIISDGAGGGIIAWQDRRSGNDDIYARRIDASGTPQWTVNGVPLCTALFDQDVPIIVSDGAGGAVVAWEDRRAGEWDVDVRRIDASGTALWTNNGVALVTMPEEQVAPSITTDGSGGAIVAWEDARDTTNRDIYARRVDSTGNLQWMIEGSRVCTWGGAQYVPVLVAGAAGDAIVAWEDLRTGTPQVYAQRMSAAGEWVNTPAGSDVGVNPSDENGNGSPLWVTFAKITQEGLTSLVIADVGPDLPGSFTLGDSKYYDVTTTATSTDPIYICIQYDEASLTVPEASLRMLHYDTALIPPAWVDVTADLDTDANQICGWTDHLSPFVIGAGSVTSVQDKPIPNRFALHANVPNPFNPITTIAYDVPVGGAEVNIFIYDVSGRLVRELVNEHRAAGSWSVQWNGEDDRGVRVASGVYFYRMRAGDFVETKKMVLLK
jgi:FlgD Ig-like domain